MLPVLYYSEEISVIVSLCVHTLKYIISAGYEPANFGSHHKHANNYTTERFSILCTYTVGLSLISPCLLGFCEFLILLVETRYMTKIIHSAGK